MSDRYLWDKTGKPDPEVERLEGLLGPFAHKGEPLELPAAAAPEATARHSVNQRRPARWAWLAPHRLAWGLAAAAALAVVAGAAWWMMAEPGWKVARIAGSPQLGEQRLAATGRAGAGAWLVTDAVSSARLSVGRIGVVELGPNSRLRILGRRGEEHRLALEQGVLDAVILAPPRQFVVETPSATAVDLGCAYSLEVDAAGGALLTVLAGWVSFEHQGRESFIPAGARCATRPGLGPGTPYFTDASPALKNALVLLDLTPPQEDARDSLLRAVLAEARREDAFTVWHLLGRLSGEDRARAFHRLSDLVPPPAGVTFQGVMADDHSMLDLWWDSLGLGGSRDWRRWRGPMPGRPS